MIKEILTTGLAALTLGCATTKKSPLEREIEKTTKRVVEVLEQPASFAVDVMTLEVLNQLWDEIQIYKQHKKRVEDIEDKGIERIKSEGLLEKIGTVKDGKVVEIDYNSNIKIPLARMEKIIFEEITNAGICSRDSAILLLPGLVKSKLDCDTTSFIHAGIMQELGLPVHESVVYAVMPGHGFVKYDDGKRKFNIETTAGIILEEKEARKYYDSITLDDMIHGRMFVKLTPRESLSLKYCNFATHCSYSNKMQAAERWIKKAIKTAPNSPSGYFFMIGVHQQQDNYKEAIKAGKIFAEKFPEYDLPELVLASIAHVMGDNKKALQHCDRAIQIGNNARAYELARNIAKAAGFQNKVNYYIRLEKQNKK